MDERIRSWSGDLSKWQDLLYEYNTHAPSPHLSRLQDLLGHCEFISSMELKLPACVNGDAK